MKSIIRISSFALFAHCLSAHAGQVELISLPETIVLAVAPDSNKPSDYAAAFGKLVGFYAQPNHTFKTVFPQMSLSLNGRSYSAIAITGTPQSAQGIEVLTLPSCEFAHKTYVGNYPGLAPTVRSIVSAAEQEGLTMNHGCGIRVLHANSPDDTPVEQLVHEIYVPVIKRQPS